MRQDFWGGKPDRDLPGGIYRAGNMRGHKINSEATCVNLLVQRT